MLYSVGLEAYRVEAIHGYYEHEWQSPQPFIFDVEVSFQSAETIEGLSNTVNYADIQQSIDQVMHNAPEPIRLMETMAERVISLLQSYGEFTAIHIRIEKPNAPLPHPGGIPYIEVDWNAES